MEANKEYISLGEKKNQPRPEKLVFPQKIKIKMNN
jgi:hypothetical protein